MNSATLKENTKKIPQESEKELIAHLKRINSPDWDSIFSGLQETFLTFKAPLHANR